MILNLDALAQLTPQALDVYRLAFQRADTVFPRFGLTTRLRIQHFLAQCLHETAGLTRSVESLNYSAERLMVVWPLRFPSLESAQACAHMPEQIAERVYGRRMGNIQPGDGWRFRGRGLLQLTGRTSYAMAGVGLGLPLVEQPELVIDEAHALEVAGWVWKSKGCNVFADDDDLTRVTRQINGGFNGIASRRNWLSDVLPALEVSA